MGKFSIVCSDRPGGNVFIAGVQQREVGDRVDGNVVSIPASTSLTCGPAPGEVSLILHMGSAAIGVTMKAEGARALGQAMAALSAPEDRPQ